MSDLYEACVGGMHVLGHRCPQCGTVTIPARFWPRGADGKVSFDHEDVKRDYPIALKDFQGWWEKENPGQLFAPTPLAHAAGKIRA